jgi:hypothetical protein
MPSKREQIEDILVDCSDKYERMSAWEYEFNDNVTVPFQATLLDIPVEVQGFRANDADSIQCQVSREKKQRWVGVEGLDEESLPEDCLRVFKLYSAWIERNY